jgi:hypothetical protein
MAPILKITFQKHPHLGPQLTPSANLHFLILQAPALVDYKEHHTDVSVRFQLEVIPEKLVEWQAAGLEARLKLSSKFATSEHLC